MVRPAVSITVQRVGQGVIIPIYIVVLDSVKDPIVVVIKVDAVRYPVIVGIVSGAIGVQVVGGAVIVRVIVGRVSVIIDILIRGVDAVSVIIEVTVVHILSAIGIGKVRRRVVDLVVNVIAVVDITALVAIVKTVVVRIVARKGLVGYAIKVEVVALVVVGDHVVVTVIVKVVRHVRTIGIFWVNSFVSGAFICVVQSIIIVISSSWRYVSGCCLSFYIIWNSIIIGINISKIG